MWPPARLWRLPFWADFALPSGVFGPCDLAPLVLDASVCLSVRMDLPPARGYHGHFAGESVNH